ncbi:MAG: O-methyltransferase [Eudoraea sp.]|nr:O-methyltransferase [Eudoraea sp.]NNK30948.1 methyltransferase [Flavobacteriaceae bacterium]
MHFLSQDLDDYIVNHSEAEPQLLRELRRETHLKVIQPRMITGHYQGRVLSMLSKLIQPRNILEIGTYTGYSALCLAEGLPDDGQLHTVEINEELQDIQKKYFDRSPLGPKIIPHIGDAASVVPELDFIFDLVFIDAGKTEYDVHFENVIKKVKSGGIILSDNVLWSGKVISPASPADKATQALQAYNEKLMQDPRVETVILPIRDGLTLSRVR